MLPTSLFVRQASAVGFHEFPVLGRRRCPGHVERAFVVAHNTLWAADQAAPSGTDTCHVAGPLLFPLALCLQILDEPFQVLFCPAQPPEQFRIDTISPEHILQFRQNEFRGLFGCLRNTLRLLLFPFAGARTGTRPFGWATAQSSLPLSRAKATLNLAASSRSSPSSDRPVANLAPGGSSARLWST